MARGADDRNAHYSAFASGGRLCGRACCGLHNCVRYLRKGAHIHDTCHRRSDFRGGRLPGITWRSMALGTQGCVRMDPYLSRRRPDRSSRLSAGSLNICLKYTKNSESRLALFYPVRLSSCRTSCVRSGSSESCDPLSRERPHRSSGNESPRFLCSFSRVCSHNDLYPSTVVSVRLPVPNSHLSPTSLFRLRAFCAFRRCGLVEHLDSGATGPGPFPSFR
jgi:hypothetical protein